MFGKMLGIADLLTVLVIILMHFDILTGWRIGFVFSAYLIIKGALFIIDINSVLDICCGIYLFIMLFGFTTILTWVVVVYLAQKGIWSLL